jgi:hypothetical protein
VTAPYRRWRFAKQTEAANAARAQTNRDARRTSGRREGKAADAAARRLKAS